MKHIKRDHTEAFCKTANGKFIIALHKDGHKELYSHWTSENWSQMKISILESYANPTNRGQGPQGIKGTKMIQMLCL